jgi:hypothetical protein
MDAGLKQAAGISPSVTLPDWTVEKWDIKALPYIVMGAARSAQP